MASIFAIRLGSSRQSMTSRASSSSVSSSVVGAGSTCSVRGTYDDHRSPSSVSRGDVHSTVSSMCHTGSIGEGKSAVPQNDNSTCIASSVKGHQSTSESRRPSLPLSPAVIGSRSGSNTLQQPAPEAAGATISRRRTGGREGAEDEVISILTSPIRSSLSISAGEAAASDTGFPVPGRSDTTEAERRLQDRQENPERSTSVNESFRLRERRLTEHRLDQERQSEEIEAIRQRMERAEHEHNEAREKVLKHELASLQAEQERRQSKERTERELLRSFPSRGSSVKVLSPSPAAAGSQEAPSLLLPQRSTSSGEIMSSCRTGSADGRSAAKNPISSQRVIFSPRPDDQTVAVASPPPAAVPNAIQREAEGMNNGGRPILSPSTGTASAELPATDIMVTNSVAKHYDACEDDPAFGPLVQSFCVTLPPSTSAQPQQQGAQLFPSSQPDRFPSGLPSPSPSVPCSVETNGQYTALCLTHSPAEAPAATGTCSVCSSAAPAASAVDSNMTEEERRLQSMEQELHTTILKREVVHNEKECLRREHSAVLVREASLSGDFSGAARVEQQTEEDRRAAIRQRQQLDLKDKTEIQRIRAELLALRRGKTPAMDDESHASLPVSTAPPTGGESSEATLHDRVLDKRRNRMYTERHAEEDRAQEYHERKETELGVRQRGLESALEEAKRRQDRAKVSLLDKQMKELDLERQRWLRAERVEANKAQKRFEASLQQLEAGPQGNKKNETAAVVQRQLEFEDCTSVERIDQNVVQENEGAVSGWKTAQQSDQRALQAQREEQETARRNQLTLESETKRQMLQQKIAQAKLAGDFDKERLLSAELQHEELREQKRQQMWQTIAQRRQEAQEGKGKAERNEIRLQEQRRWQEEYRHIRARSAPSGRKQGGGATTRQRPEQRALGAVPGGEADETADKELILLKRRAAVSRAEERIKQQRLKERRAVPPFLATAPADRPDQQLMMSRQREASTGSALDLQREEERQYHRSLRTLEEQRSLKEKEADAQQMRAILAAENERATLYRQQRREASLVALKDRNDQDELWRLERKERSRRERLANAQERLKNTALPSPSSSTPTPSSCQPRGAPLLSVGTEAESPGGSLPQRASSLSPKRAELLLRPLSTLEDVGVVGRHVDSGPTATRTATTIEPTTADVLARQEELSSPPLVVASKQQLVFGGRAD